VLGVVVGAWLIASLTLLAARDRSKGPKLAATIVSIGVKPTRLRTEWVTVVARSSNGISGSQGLSRERLDDLNCRIGDRVDAQVTGATLIFDVRTCRGDASAS
jgi:hypothetical protein